MKTSRKLSQRLFLALIGISLAGCPAKDLWTSAPGQYEGVLSFVNQGQSQRILVSATVTNTSSHVMNVAVKALKGDLTWSFVVSAPDSSHLSINGVVLDKATDTCALKVGTPTQPGPRVCFDKRQIIMELPKTAAADTTSLVVDRVDPNRSSPMETPDTYTTDQLVDRAIIRNFQTRAQFDTVAAARLTAQQDALNLLPHLSTGTIYSMGFSGYTAIYTAVGDMLPFVFPNRWLQVRQDSLAATEQYDALILMRADTANIVEGLAYTIERDQNIVAQLNQNVTDITSVRDQVKEKEKSQILEAGSSDDITSIIHSVQEEVITLNEGIAEEYQSLAVAAGFFNPYAITSVQVSHDTSPDAPPQLNDASSMLEVVAQRSFELDQAQAEIQQAKAARVGRFFEWMDPDGSSPGFGLALIPYLAAGGVQVDYTENQYKSQQNLLSQKVTNAVGQQKEYLAAYAKAKDDTVTQAARVFRNVRDLRLGLNFSLSNLASALSSQVSAGIYQATQQAGFYVTEANIDRLLFNGTYANLQLDGDQKNYFVKNSPGLNLRPYTGTTPAPEPAPAPAP